MKLDLGIKGKKAIVCASSKGLGFGCALSLAEAGVDLIINSRNPQNLASAANLIKSKFQVRVETVAADITTKEGQDAVIEKAKNNLDILVTNAGGPPPGVWSDWNRSDFILALDANMLTPISLMKEVLPGMMEKGWGRIVNITSQSVKAPIPALGLSNSARAGLTGYVAGTSRQVAEYGVTINNLQPGVHDTDRIKSLDLHTANQAGITPAEAKLNRRNAIPAKRYGTIQEFGAACAFLCSQKAGFIIGQNILLDGGAVNATM